MKKIILKSLNIFVALCFSAVSFNIPQVRAFDGVTTPMPTPGSMVFVSPVFTPDHLDGMTIHPENPLEFDFLVNKGGQDLDEVIKKTEYKQLIKYFLASLTVPDEDQWVNLSPYEKNRIINDDLGKTEMGRDLLAQDYLLKQLTSSLMYPENGLGKEFWNRVYERAYKEYGTTDIPVNTFNKVWIVPDQAVVYESGSTVYILKSHLKVMLEEDYLSLSKHNGITSTPTPSQNNKTHTVASKVIREIILPVIEKEVNEGRNFAQLRQVLSGMILATWYKKALKESLLGKIYADKAKLKGVDQDPKANDLIYKQYLSAFKKGVYNYIKEDEDQYTKQPVARKYFAGGFWNPLGDGAMVVVNKDNITPDEAALIPHAVKEMSDDVHVIGDFKPAVDGAMLGKTLKIAGAGLLAAGVAAGFATGTIQSVWDNIPSIHGNSLQYSDLDLQKINTVISSAKRVSTPEEFFNARVYDFSALDFDSLDSAKRLITKWGQPADNFKTIPDAVSWLNSSILPYKLYKKYLETNPGDPDIDELLGPNFKSLTDSQLTQLSQSDDWKKARWDISRKLFKGDTPLHFGQKTYEIEESEWKYLERYQSVINQAATQRFGGILHSDELFSIKDVFDDPSVNKEAIFLGESIAVYNVHEGYPVPLYSIYGKYFDGRVKEMSTHIRGMVFDTRRGIRLTIVIPENSERPIVYFSEINTYQKELIEMTPGQINDVLDTYGLAPDIKDKLVKTLTIYPTYAITQQGNSTYAAHLKSYGTLKPFRSELQFSPAEFGNIEQSIAPIMDKIRQYSPNTQLPQFNRVLRGGYWNRTTDQDQILANEVNFLNTSPVLLQIYADYLKQNGRENLDPELLQATPSDFLKKDFDLNKFNLTKEGNALKRLVVKYIFEIPISKEQTNIYNFFVHTVKKDENGIPTLLPPYEMDYDDLPADVRIELRHQLDRQYEQPEVVTRLRRHSEITPSQNQPRRSTSLEQGPKKDAAQAAAPGGIDLNSKNMNLIDLKRDGKGVPLPFAQQDMATLSHITGFEPQIREILPVTGPLPILSEFNAMLKDRMALASNV